MQTPACSSSVERLNVPLNTGPLHHNSDIVYRRRGEDTRMCILIQLQATQLQQVAMLLYGKHQGAMEYCTTAGGKHKVKVRRK